MNTGRSFNGQLPPRALAAVFAVLIVGAILFAVVSSRNRRPTMQEAFLPAKPQRATSALAAATRTPTPTKAALAAVQPSATVQPDCTYVSEYWKDNPQAWMVENILIGRFSYTKKEAIAVLAADPQNLRAYLLKQFFTAVLNTAAGVDAGAVSDILTKASAWFDANALKPELTPEEASQGEALARALDEYNSGATGPGACPGQTILPITSFSGTATPTPTATVLLATPGQPGAATIPTEKLPRPVKRVPPATPAPAPAPTQAPPPEPTSRPHPTQPPPQPTQPPPQPTQPPPQPTSAPPEPTDAPKPTKKPKPTKAPKLPPGHELWIDLPL